MPQADPSPPARPKRRWFQYSLRTLLILTTVVAALFAWWSHKARRQKLAVEALQRAGALVVYDHKGTLPDDFGLAFWGEEQGPSFWPTWLVQALGVDYFSHVHCVAINNPVVYHMSQNHAVDDTTLEYIKHLPAVRLLCLNSAQVTDTGLRNLESLTSLRSLELINNPITDLGLEHLRGLTNLERLNLWNTKVTAAGISRLQQALPNCKIER